MGERKKNSLSHLTFRTALVVTSNNNSKQFQSIKRRYGEYNSAIQNIARQFCAVRHVDLYFFKKY